MHGKNRNIRDLSSCVVQKFNGYDILRSELKNEEKQFHELIDIFYEPVNDESSVKYFLTDHLHLAYRSYGLKLGIDNDKMKIGSLCNVTTAASTLYVMVPLKNT